MRSALVDLDLTDDQEMFRATTRKFLEQVSSTARVRELWASDEGFDRSAWAQAAELGWFAAFASEEDGGGSVSGRAVADACIVAEEAGRALFPGPVVATNLVVDAIARNGSAEQRSAHLPGLIGGESIGTWAFDEPSDRWDGDGIDLAAMPDGEGFRLSGLKTCVQEAGSADLLLVSARAAEGLTQFLVPTATPGVEVSQLQSLDLGRRFADVRFEDVVVAASAVVGEVGGAAAAIERQRDIAAILTCAETVGAVDRCFEMTLEYARMRKAFGRPIGSYQALKHRFADMLLWLEGSKAIAVTASEAADLDVDRAALASIAKSYISDRGQVIVRDCLQIHGGIGYTWEYDLHLFLRRIDSNAALFGGPARHEDRLAGLVGL
jgi:alkylation response protein AidB-like acyl-CoA dehydrogenase